MLPEFNLITQVSSLGLGAVIAILMAYWKRADDARYQKSLEDFINRMEVRDQRTLTMMETTAVALQSLQKTVESLVTLSRLEERIVSLESRRGQKWADTQIN